MRRGVILMALLAVAVPGCTPTHERATAPRASVRGVVTRVSSAGDPAHYLLEIQVESRGEILSSPRLLVDGSDWASVNVHEGERRLADVDLTGEELTVKWVEPLKSGLFLAIRCTARADGDIDADIRGCSVRDGQVEWSLKERVAVESGGRFAVSTD